MRGITAACMGITNTNTKKNVAAVANIAPLLKMLLNEIPKKSDAPKQKITLMKD
jgi:hypothetical protein